MKTRLVPLVEMNSGFEFVLAQSLVFCVMLCHCLSFGPSFVLSFPLRIKSFDYPFSIFKLFHSYRKFIAISLVFHSNSPH